MLQMDWTHTDFINGHLTFSANTPNAPMNLCMLKSFKPTILQTLFYLILFTLVLPNACILLRFVSGLINGSSSSSSSSSSGGGGSY